MKCQILFSGEKKEKTINLSSAEVAQRVAKVNHRCRVQTQFVVFVVFMTAIIPIDL